MPGTCANAVTAQCGSSNGKELELYMYSCTAQKGKKSVLFFGAQARLSSSAKKSSKHSMP